MLSNSIRAAVIGFARTLATEVAPFGVTVNNLLPGFTRTERMVELSEVTASKDGVTRERAATRGAWLAAGRGWGTAWARGAARPARSGGSAASGARGAW